MRVDGPVFSLEDFEGPLDLLLHLIENKELDIFQVIIEKVLFQYQDYLHTLNEHDLDLGAEFLSIVSSLMLLKSKTLLPKDSQTEEEILSESTLRLDIIEQLVHYYKFKNIAETLAQKESEQTVRYQRGVDKEHLLSDEPAPLKSTPQAVLSELFIKVLERQKQLQIHFIQEEDYKISDKIKELKLSLGRQSSLAFNDIFSFNKPKGELIALFIAMLEIFKQGLAKLDQSGDEWIIQTTEGPETL